MPRPKGSADLLEDRRKRALALLDRGYSLHEVGRRVGCAAVSVMRWRDARRRGGAKALKVRFSPGRPRKLDAPQRKRLVGLLLKGATAHGWRTNLWTTARIAELIRREFSIEYHRDHIGRLLHSLGMERAETGAARSGAERRSHRTLEAFRAPGPISQRLFPHGYQCAEPNFCLAKVVCGILARPATKFS
jgi:transposase